MASIPLGCPQIRKCGGGEAEVNNTANLPYCQIPKPLGPVMPHSFCPAMPSSSRTVRLGLGQATPCFPHTITRSGWSHAPFSLWGQAIAPPPWGWVGASHVPFPNKNGSGLGCPLPPSAPLAGASSCLLQVPDQNHWLDPTPR